MSKKYPKKVNAIHCSIKGHGEMLLTVEADFDNLYVETYVCLHKNCDNQASLFLGGKNLAEYIREYHGINKKY